MARAIFGAALTACTLACVHYPAPQLSDDEVRAIARQPLVSGFDTRPRVVGYQGSTPVSVQVRCGDICPRFATRIVAYEVDLKDCDRVGGRIELVDVTMAFAVIAVRVCTPRALTDR